MDPGDPLTQHSYRGRKGKQREHGASAGLTALSFSTLKEDYEDAIVAQPWNATAATAQMSASRLA